jgi:phage shock protein C
MFGIGNMEFILIAAIIVLIIVAPAVLLIFFISRLRGDEKHDDAHETSPFFSPDFTENQRKILKMIRQDKISIDDGERLLTEINKKALLETPASSIAKPLRRRSDNRRLGGVCGAIADYFGINSTLVRLGFVLIAIITGFFTMIIFYIMAALVLPYDNHNKAVVKRN